MTKAERKQLERFVGTGPACAVNLAAYLKSKAPKRKPASYQKQKTLSRKGTRAALVAAVRPLVEARAAGRCECCGKPFDETIAGHATWDEFYGREHISVEETWMLRWGCHQKKGWNDPTREAWDETFKMHCAIHRYPFRKRFCKKLPPASPTVLPNPPGIGTSNLAGGSQQQPTAGPLETK